MPYRHPATFLLAVSAFTFCLVSGGVAKEPAKTRPPSLNELSMEVAALQAVRQFQFTSAQLETIRKLARETAGPAGARQAARVSDEFQHTLTDLHNALIEGDDDERIDDLQEMLDGLRDAENPDLDDDIEVTPAARRRARELFRQLSARQIVAYLSNYGSEFPDPLEQLIASLDKVRGLEDKAWKALREELSDAVGRLVGGLDADKAGKASDQVVQLLIRTRALKAEEFKKQRAELEKEARKIVGEMSPLQVIRHVVEQDLAELLSNPRLTAALDAQQKK
jgi:hypothetical protein